MQSTTKQKPKYVKGAVLGTVGALGLMAISTQTANADTVTVKAGDTITREKAYSEMMYELDKKWQGISKYIKVFTNKEQQSALISFAYNCGIGAFAGSTLLKKLNQGLYKEIPNELLKWTKGGGVHLKGLWRRRLSEALLFNSESKFIVPLSKVPDGWINIRAFNENMKKLAI